jgi:hypothetical protein
MVDPVVFDLVKQHHAELLAEREMDRLASQLRARAQRPSPDAWLKGILPVPGRRQHWQPTRTA